MLKISAQSRKWADLDWPCKLFLLNSTGMKLFVSFLVKWTVNDKYGENYSQGTNWRLWFAVNFIFNHDDPKFPRSSSYIDDDTETSGLILCSGRVNSWENINLQFIWMPRFYDTLNNFLICKNLVNMKGFSWLLGGCNRQVSLYCHFSPYFLVDLMS